MHTERGKEKQWPNKLHAVPNEDTVAHIQLLVFVSPGCRERLHSRTIVGVDKIVHPLSPIVMTT